jgi:hypothetical protein
MMERPEKWRWGAPASEQPKLQPLLDALRRLQDGGLTTARVVATFHRRRVLPLMARWLRMDEMEEGAPLEGCRMSDASLSTTEVTRRVAYTVAAGFTVVELNRVRMCLTRGYISLVSMTILLMFSLFSTVCSSVADVVPLLGAGGGERL